jgi:DNA mismatch repair protein MutL
MSDQIVSINPIRKLPISLSNQIAAGEVVERPASILKELIENSIDAGASCIHIEIQQAGLDKISVTDNGHGIPASELCLAVSPHATSKIYSQEQLGQINTLGFRGEALASIASVSKFEILSKVADDDTAWKLDYSNNTESSYDQHDLDKLKLVPVTHQIGTTVIANNIFYNTPARRKYLRTERTEYLHLERTIKQLILSDFNTAFIFKHNDREVFRFRQAQDEQAKSRRVLKLCGKSFYDNTVTLNFQASGMTITGWLANGGYSRASADIQYFYINGRIIRDRVIFHAIRQAFKDSLPEGRYVAYVLYLTIKTESIDVNVHPTKHEVRFNDMRLVHDFLSHVITEALNSKKNNNLELNSKTEFEKNHHNEMTDTDYVAESGTDYLNIDNYGYNRKQSNYFFGGILKIVEQHYIVTEYNSTIALIDIKKAQSFLMHFTLVQQFQNNTIITKPLLIPISITLEKEQVDCIEKNLDIISKTGINVTVSGLNTLLLRAIPVILKNINYLLLFENIATLLTEYSNSERDDFIPIICCSKIIDTLDYNIEQAEFLLCELNKLEKKLLFLEHKKWWQNIDTDYVDILFKL